MTKNNFISSVGHIEINKKTKKISIFFDECKYLLIDNKLFLFLGSLLDISGLCKKYSLLNHKNHINIIADLYKNKERKINDIIEGNYSLVIIDKKTMEIEIYSDLGSSFPIYYCNSDDIFLLGTNLKKIVKKDNSNLLPDMISISRYLIYGEINNLERTFYKNIKRTKASSLTCIKNFKNIEIFNQNIKFNNNVNNPLKFRKIFENIINSLKISKDKISILLSGGLDSSAIASVLKPYKESNYYSIQTAETTVGEVEFNNENKLINKTVKFWNLNHKYIHWEDDYNLNTIDSIIEKLAEPFKSAQSLIQFSLRKESAKDGCKQLFYGEGGYLFGIAYDGKYFWAFIPELILNLRLISAIRHCYLVAKKNYLRTFKIFLKSIMTTSWWLINYKKTPFITPEKNYALKDFKKRNYNFNKKTIYFSKTDFKKYNSRSHILKPYKSTILNGILLEKSPHQVNFDFIVNDYFKMKSGIPILSSKFIKLVMNSEIDDFFEAEVSRGLWRKINVNYLPEHIVKEYGKYNRPSNNIYFVKNIILPYFNNPEFIEFINIFIDNFSSKEVNDITKNDFHCRFWVRVFLLWRWSIKLNIKL